MIVSVKVKRLEGKELVHIDSLCDAAPATNKYLQRPLHHLMLVGTHIPEQYQPHLGALIVLLFGDPKIVDVEVWQNDRGYWVADSVVATGRGHRLRRGKGDTPLQAMIELIVDIQRN